MNAPVYIHNLQEVITISRVAGEMPFDVAVRDDVHDFNACEMSLVSKMIDRDRVTISVPDGVKAKQFMKMVDILDSYGIVDWES